MHPTAGIRLNNSMVWPKPIDNKPSHWVLPPGDWRLKLKSVGSSMQIIMCKFDAEIKSYKDGKTIWIYHNHYLPCTYNSKRCRYVCNCYYYDRVVVVVHISVAVDMRTLLHGNNFSSRTNDQVAARRVKFIIKRLWFDQAAPNCRVGLTKTYESIGFGLTMGLTPHTEPTGRSASNSAS